MQSADAKNQHGAITHTHIGREVCNPPVCVSMRGRREIVRTWPISVAASMETDVRELQPLNALCGHNNLTHTHTHVWREVCNPPVCASLRKGDGR